MPQTNLEKLGISTRTTQLAHKDRIYAKGTGNEYNESHPNALTPNTPDADGRERGKGTNTPMSYLTLPSTKNPTAGISATVNTINGGSSADITQRNAEIIRNLYSETNQYSELSVDTSANVLDGQIVIS